MSEQRTEATISYLQGCVDSKDEELRRVGAERDRLRAALERVAHVTGTVSEIPPTTRLYNANSISRAALAEVA